MSASLLSRLPRGLATPLAVVASALVLVAGGLALTSEDGPITVTAELDDSAGLFVGNDVGILGVKVGEVTDIRPRGRIVEVDLEVQDDVDVPASAGAVVVSRSVATDRYVELTPADADGPRMKDGARIPLERTRTPVEFDEVLESLGDFSEGLLGKDGDGQALRAFLAEGADALDGRGRDVNRTVRKFARAAEVLSGHRGDLVGTVEELDALTTLLATNREVVDEFVTSVADTTDLFAEERHAFGRSLTALSRALRSLATFIEDHRGQLTGSLEGLTRVTESLLEHQAELKETVEVLPLTLENLGNAVDGSRRLDVKLPPQYLSPAQAATEQICAAFPVFCDELGTSPDLIDLIRGLAGGAR
jgi:virulence factor Mce-like protein